MLLLALLIGAPVFVYAQESNPRQYGTLEGQNENRYYESNAEGDPNAFRAASKADSALFKNSIKKSGLEAPKQVTKKPEDDAVPFNFLYYIIQRFKTSDIIED